MIDCNLITVNSGSATTRTSRTKRRNSKGKTRYKRVCGKYKAKTNVTKVTPMVIPKLTTPMYSK